MNHFKAAKQPTKKQALQRMETAESIALYKELEMERLNSNWGLKFDMVVKLFEAALKDAGTLGEAKKWYATWTKQVNDIDHTSDDAEQQMDAIIEQHGFEFNITPVAVTHQEMCGRTN